MLHQFRTPQGDIEVTVAKQGDVWHLGEHQAIVEDDGRLSIHLSNGMKGYATTAKVGDVWWVHFEGHTFCLERIEPGASQSGDGGGLIAPMPGKVLEVFVEIGQSVEAGETLMVLEAMKMEHALTAPFDGTVTELAASEGGQVQVEAVLAVVEPKEE